MIDKKYFKKTPFCRVIFMLPKEAAVGVKRVNLVGDFNNWDSRSTPMKKTGGGKFSATVHLREGQEYQYLYLIDGKYWELEREADKFVKCPLNNCDNSFVV
jgi:hypothetical protein